MLLTLPSSRSIMAPPMRPNIEARRAGGQGPRALLECLASNRDREPILPRGVLQEQPSVGRQRAVDPKLEARAALGPPKYHLDLAKHGAGDGTGRERGVVQVEQAPGIEHVAGALPVDGDPYHAVAHHHDRMMAADELG